MKNFKVEEVSIPKLKNGYLTNYRTIRFVSKDEYWSVDCFPNLLDIFVFDKAEVSVKLMKNSNPVSLSEEGWIYEEGYLCVSSHDDTNDYIIYEFYKDGYGDEPYSVIWGRTTEKFDVGDSYVFCCKKVE